MSEREGAVGEVLEWVQCRSCGRRYRWNADIAGSSIECQCGVMIDVPELEGYGGATAAGATMIETADSPTTASPELDDWEDEGLPVDVRRDPTVKRTRRRGDGLFGLTTGGQLVMWFSFLLLSLTFVIHAIVTGWTVYIVLAAIAFPITAWKFNRVRRRWQRGRPLKTALVHLVEELS